MKYLIINGSPKKNGNTFQLVEQTKTFIAAEDSRAEFRVIHLIDENLPFCLGCSACFRLGHEKCPHRAVMDKLIAAIEEADGVIISSSAFFMRETAIWTNVFDHFCYMLHRPRFFKSKALVLTTAGGVGAGKAAKSIAAFLKGIGFNRCYRFNAAALSWNDYKITDITKEKLKKAVGRFQKDVASHTLHSPSATILIPYNVFRGMSIPYAKGTEFETQDGVYWLEEHRKSSLYDSSVHVPFYKKPIGHLFYLIGKLAGKKIMITYKK